MGYGKNAFYGRKSKSLQFYYFDRGGERIYTCLSADIINHEFGHAVLDGIRPLFFESSLVETGAFHEFVGDFSAILIILRNNHFRRRLAESTGGDLSAADHLANIAEQFGHAVDGNPYLRTAQNERKMSDVAGHRGPHLVSEALTSTMFAILMGLSNLAVRKGKSAAKALWFAMSHMQRIAVQPLELLPPVDATFEDYARAVVRAERLANPLDPYGFRDVILEAFEAREILDAAAVKELREPDYLLRRLRLDVVHDIADISRSRAAS